MKKSTINLTLTIVFAAALVGSMAIAFADASTVTVTPKNNPLAPERSQTWTWSSNNPSSTFRYCINRIQDWTWAPDNDNDHYGRFFNYHYGMFRFFSNCNDRFTNATSATEHFGNGTFYIHVQAYDDVNGTSSIAVASTTLDNIPPRIARHADITIDSSGATTTTVVYTTPSATDNMDTPAGVPVTVSCTPSSPAQLTDGRHTIRCTATDRAGNVGYSHFNATVRNSNSYNPTITATFTDPATTTTDLVLEASGPSGNSVTYNITSADSHGNDLTSSTTCTPTLATSTLSSASSFPATFTAPIGFTNLVCSITVSHQKIFEETVATVEVDDTTGPTIQLVGAQTINLNVGDTFTDPGANVIDTADPSVVVEATGVVDTTTPGTYTIYYNATDAFGVSAPQVTRTVIVSAVSNNTLPGGPNYYYTGNGGGGGTGYYPTTSGGSGSGLGSGAGSGSGSNNGWSNVGSNSGNNGGNGGGSGSGAGCNASSSIFVFTRTLRLGSVGADVKQLQIFLNSHGFTVATSGIGSSGFEATIFGKSTKAALIKFQEANAKDVLTPQGLTKGNGVLGTLTRKFINTLIKGNSQCSSSGSSLSAAQIQELINSLLAQLAALQAQLSALQGH